LPFLFKEALLSISRIADAAKLTVANSIRSIDIAIANSQTFEHSIIIAD
jgi:hypothetical protein